MRRQSVGDVEFGFEAEQRQRSEAITGPSQRHGMKRPIEDEVDGSCSTGIERAKVQLSSTAKKGATQ